ncbi:DMT family transporter [Faecalibaculum rodentium]|uniref:DMT family transporter n=1 Tax=Faecalibaculum rodentium TaxID=1702221 RepID=UPI00256F3447|nr:DMT family transporter [Faecalibaculum rodentium]
MISGLAGGFLWALDTVILSLVLAPFSMSFAAPVAATALHDVFSALWLALLATVGRRWSSVVRALKHKDGRRVMLAALLGGPVGMAGYVMAIRFLGPGLAASISSFYPALGLAASALLFHEPVKRHQVAGMVLSLVCLVLMSGQAAGGTDFWLGILCALCSTTGWAAEGLLVQKAASLDNDIALLLRQSVSGAVFWILVLPLFGGLPVALSMAQSPWLVAAASLAGTASYLCYYLAIHRIGAARAMPLNITYCAWAVVLAWVFQGTTVSGPEAVFCAGVILGGVLSAW